MTHADTYASARARAEAKYRFYVHAAIYVAVMTLLVVVNMLTSPESSWSIWPLLGWGLAVAIHGARVFLPSGKGKIVDALTEHEMKRSGPDDPGRSP